MYWALLIDCQKTVDSDPFSICLTDCHHVVGHAVYATELLIWFGSPAAANGGSRVRSAGSPSSCLELTEDCIAGHYRVRSLLIQLE